ncbi:MAG: lysylphosphatidylglycerol synthase transmembrane domain-containing protein [Candidatus Limnocylindrales bacterium]
MRRLTTGLAGLAISASLIGLVLLEVSPGEALAILAQAQLAILVLAVPLVLFDLCARTVRWDILLAHDPRPGFRETFRYIVVGYLVNIMLPGRLGEFVRAHLAGTRAHVGQLRALGSIVLERGLDVVVAATLGAIAARLVGIGSGVTGAFTVVAVGGWVVLLTATLVPDRWMRRLIDGFVATFGRGRGQRVVPHLGAFGHALVDAATPRVVAPALLLSLVSWVTGTLVFAIAAASLGLTVPPLVLLAMVTAANLGAAIPSAPAGIGPFEFAVVYVGTAAGLDGPQVLALGVLSHLLGTVPVAIAGALSLRYVDWRFDELRAFVRARREGTSIEAAEPPA